jgi:GT2 family glycosyltransferase
VSAAATLRVCIFTADLGAIESRKDAILQQLRELTGEQRFDVSFVGFRQTQPLQGEMLAYQPHVVAEQYTKTRLANTMLRMIDIRMAPIAAARVPLRLCAPAFVEAILASDPDVVLLDVSWGPVLKTILARQFSGPIRVTGEQRPINRADLQWGRASSSVKVSIVLPTHNGSRYLRQSIQSCLDQSHRNLELIVVDDGSMEDIRAVVGEFTDPRIQYIRHATNQGLPAALNTGFARASGAYLTWTSDDNYYSPDAIERMARFLQRHSDVAFVYASAHIIDEISEGRPTRVQRPYPPADLINQNSVGGCFLYTREVYLAIGDYDSAATLVEDYDYWVRVSQRFRMQRIVAPLYYYRYHDQSLTSRYSREDVAERFNLARRRNKIAYRTNDIGKTSTRVATRQEANDELTRR